MATFQTRVEDLIGSVGDTQLISDSLTDAAAELITLLPKECLWVASVNSGDVTALNYNVEKCLILNVIRENGTDGQYEDCKEVSPSYFRRVQDVNSMWYPSSSEPVYLVKNSHVFVYPTPGVSPNAFQVEYVTNPSVAYGGTSISGFPDEYEHLVVLGGSVKCLQRVMNSNTVNLTIPVPAVPVLGTVTYSSQSVSILDLSVSAGPPTAPTITTVSYTGISDVSIVPVLTSSVQVATDSTLPAYSSNSVVGFGTSAGQQFKAISNIPAIPDYTVIATAPTLPSSPSIGSPGVASSSIALTTQPPIYIPPAPGIALTAYGDYTSGLSESDPGAFVISATPPPSPGLPTISYANASVGDAVAVAVDSIAVAVDSIAGAQDGISVAQDSITGAVDAYTGEMDTSMSGTAAGVTDTEAPTNAAGTGSTASTGSAYTAPSVTGGAGLTGMESGTINDDTDQIEFDTWWDTLGEMIENEEDIEMASAQIQKIRAYIDAFQAEVQDASAAMQATIEDARQSTQASIATAGDATRASIANAANDVSTNNASIASLTQAAIATHQADTTIKGAGIGSLTSAKVAKMQQSTSASITKMRESTSAATAKMQQSTSAAIAKMQQSTSASTSKMQLSTQASIEKMRQSSNINLQNASKTLEASIQDYSQEVALYRARVDGYQAEVAKETQEYQQILAHYQLELSTSAQNWSAEQVQKIQKYQAEQQDSLQEFNKSNAEYQAELQKAIQQAQINATEYIKEGDLTIQATIQDYVQEMNRFSEDIKKYQTDINKEVQTWQGNTNKKVQIYQSESANILQQHAQEMQDNLNLFNEENAQYQGELNTKYQEAQHQNNKHLKQADIDLQVAVRNADKSQEHQIQEKMQDMQALIANNGDLLNKFRSEMENYQAKVNREVQEKQINNTATLTKYQNDIQNAIQASQATMNDNNNKIAKYTAELQAYQAVVSKGIQESTLKFQQYQRQYDQLKAEYERGLQALPMRFVQYQGQVAQS